MTECIRSDWRRWCSCARRNGTEPDELRRKLLEKDVQLREIQHRVKNNLQMITALIRIESRNASDASKRSSSLAGSRHGMIGIMLKVSQATSPQELDDTRELMRAFVAWHRERHVEDISLIDRYFDEREFEAELAGLPGKYAPPTGTLLIAYLTDKPAGCVALRDLGTGTCEMKRMFVPPAYRGHGIGRALADRVLREAKSLGYERIRLDTSIHQNEAMRLYEAAGFRRIPPYYELPADLREWLVFFEREI